MKEIVINMINNLEYLYKMNVSELTAKNQLTNETNKILISKSDNLLTLFRVKGENSEASQTA